MATTARDTLAEDAVRGWLRAPWVSFDYQCAMVRALGVEVSFDPNLIDTMGPKGALVPSLAAVAMLNEGNLSGMAFGEFDFPSPTGPQPSYFRELWFLKASDERPWFDFLSEEMASDPHAKDEPTDPPIRSWMWAHPRREAHWVRLVCYPGGGIKISQINRIQNEQG
ncbi:MAG TPA: hypothetical protein VEA80_03160 [Vitreimonas sp.]|nr:hypothetical protein [Vitreimonas sp.]